MHLSNRYIPLDDVHIVDLSCFSAIVDRKRNVVRLNIADEERFNAVHISSELFQNKTHINAPLSLWLEAFQPLLYSLVNEVYPYYERLYPDKQDVQSILYLTVAILYDKDYYLNKHLIRRAFINKLNEEVRKLKLTQNDVSLDDIISYDDMNNPLTYADIIACDDDVSTSSADENELFLKVKTEMLKDISPLTFKRILIQLESKTISPDVSKLITKYRKKLNPAAKKRRPNR